MYVWKVKRFWITQIQITPFSKNLEAFFEFILKIQQVSNKVGIVNTLSKGGRPVDIDIRITEGVNPLRGY